MSTTNTVRLHQVLAARPKKSIAHSLMPEPYQSGCRPTALPARCIR